MGCFAGPASQINDTLRTTLRLLANLFEDWQQFMLVVAALQTDTTPFRIVADRRQRLVKLMGKTGGHFAQGAEALRPGQSSFSGT
ncbi:hypothetical protein D3C78_1638160 [compost metagenome]